jgi:small subunit ribosomal protein S2
MALPDFSMRQLLEAGCHFGHQTHRWNPKMKDFIFGERSNIHIIDLSQTVPLLHQALVKVRETAAKGGRVLFVGTKRQAQEPLANAASRCAQYYMNQRWLGGTLTNWRTISNSIARLRELESMFESEGGLAGLTKKEQLMLTREREKLDRSLGGIKDMGGTPDLMFVIDTNKEAIAIQEARKLGIPVVAVVDTNCDPDPIDFPIPGNDDASRAIALYCDLIADAVLDGMSDSQMAMGMDLGEAEAPVESLVEETAAEEAAAAEAPAKEAPAKEAKAKKAPAKKAAADEAPADEAAAQTSSESDKTEA